MKTTTVRDLLKGLEEMPLDQPVKVWLPGTTIALGGVFKSDRHGAVLIEGNIEAGTALDLALGGVR